MRERAIDEERNDRPDGLATRRGRAWVASGMALLCLAAASPVAADEYDPQRAGHPVRIVAYILHPVGVMLDVLIFRPAHWFGTLPVVDEFFGHEVYDD